MNNTKAGETSKGNNPKPGDDKPKAAETSKEKNPKPEETTKEISPKPAGTTKKVSLLREKSSEPQQPQRFSQDTPKTSVDEGVLFFLDLYPDLRRHWNSIVYRLSTSAVTNERRRRSSLPEIYLKREIGLLHAINYVVLVTLGAGLFVTPSKVLEITGSTFEALLVWFFSGLFSLLIAITYGELVSLVSQSGERFSYLLAAYSTINSFVGPLPAFLSVWIDGLFLAPAQVSLLATLISEYLYSPFASQTNTYLNENEPDYLKTAIGVCVICVITYINFRTIKTCLRIQRILGIFKATIILLVIGGGIYSLNKGCTDSFDGLFKNMKGDAKGIIKAMYQGMWSYEGWSNVVTVSEETKNPLRTIPRAVLIGLPLVTLLYLLMNISFLAVLTPKEMIEAKFNYVLRFEEKLFGSNRMIMPSFFALSAISCAMGIQLGTARTVFAAGREGHMPDVHGYLNVERCVPTPALLTQALLSLIYLMYLPIIDYILNANYVTWSFYGFSFIALIILRIRMPEKYRLYKTPLCMPIILTTISVLVTIDPLFRDRSGQKALYISLLFVIVGLIVYYVAVYKQARIFCMDRLTKFVKVALNVAPPTALPEDYRYSDLTSRGQTVAKTLGSQEKYYKTVVDQPI